MTIFRLAVVTAALGGWMAGPALSEAAFTAEKICGLAKAPDGYVKLDLFLQTSQDYQPLFNVYQAAHKKTLLVSNINNGCWLILSPDFGFENVAETNAPFEGYALNMDTASRKEAGDAFWQKVDECNQNEGNYSDALYYINRFKSDYPINRNDDGPSYCFQALSFGSTSLVLEASGRRIFIDIIAGTAFLGETEQQ